MHVGGLPVVLDRPAGGGKALRDELTAERALALWTAGRPDPRVVVGTARDIQQCEQSAHRTVPASLSASTSPLPSPNHSDSTPAVSSPSAGAATAWV